MAVPKAERAVLRETWRMRIADYRTSGMTSTAWCAANHVTPKQLWYWARKFARGEGPKESRAGWMPVQVTEQSDIAEHPLLVRIGQAVIEVRAGYDAGLLRDVVHTLESLC